jgi:DNA-binding protein Fis
MIDDVVNIANQKIEELERLSNSVNDLLKKSLENIPKDQADQFTNMVKKEVENPTVESINNLNKFVETIINK